ncbi:MAG: DUF6266 family protein [Salinivirgaceae bacterium]|jgi:hypothetical protein|nr:DUF6266 family protein [Salinivirgaceae bacterium]
MGKISQGILGGFRGKVGNVIGGNWKGIDYMRVKPASVANPKTEGQVGQRNKFSTVLQFLQPMKDHVKIGFKDFAIKKTEFNSAMSYNLNNAVIGDAENASIDYSKALVTRGSLSPVRGFTAGSDLIGQLQMTWTNNSDEQNANPNDKAFVLVYNEGRGEAISLISKVKRTVGSLDITLPDNYQGENVEVFLSFITADEKSVSESRYGGSVTVMAN